MDIAQLTTTLTGIENALLRRKCDEIEGAFEELDEADGQTREQYHVSISGRLGSLERDLLDDVNDSPHGIIMFESSEKRAAEQLVKKSNGQLFIFRAFLKVTSMNWTDAEKKANWKKEKDRAREAGDSLRFHRPGKTPFSA